MNYMISEINARDSTTVETLLMWILIILLCIILLAMIIRLVNKLRGDNKVFYSEKGAINLRIGKMPDIRVVTKNCKDFKFVVVEKTLIISYANPFGGLKEFNCQLVGDPVKKPFEFKFTEQDFKKFCYHIKPGNVSVNKNRVTFNYNLSVRGKLNYIKEEV